MCVHAYFCMLYNYTACIEFFIFYYQFVTGTSTYNLNLFTTYIKLFVFKIVKKVMERYRISLQHNNSDLKYQQR